MGWSDVSELVKVLGAVATACAAWFAAYTAYRGLQKWRDETLGKRKTELAEQVLASFYEARAYSLGSELPSDRASTSGKSLTANRVSGLGLHTHRETDFGRQRRRAPIRFRRAFVSRRDRERARRRCASSRYIACGSPPAARRRSGKEAAYSSAVTQLASDVISMHESLGAQLAVMSAVNANSFSSRP